MMRRRKQSTREQTQKEEQGHEQVQGWTAFWLEQEQQQVHEPEAFGSDEREVQAQHEEEQKQEEEQEHASRIAEVEPSRPCAHSQEHERMTVAQVNAACVQTLLHWHLCLPY